MRLGKNRDNLVRQYEVEILCVNMRLGQPPASHPEGLPPHLKSIILYFTGEEADLPGGEAGGSY